MRKTNYFKRLTFIFGLAIGCQASAAIEREVRLKAQLEEVIEVTSARGGAFEDTYELLFKRGQILRSNDIPVEVRSNIPGVQITVKLDYQPVLKTSNNDEINLVVRVGKEKLKVNDVVNFPTDSRNADTAVAGMTTNITIESEQSSEKYQAGSYAGTVSINFSTRPSSI